MTSKEFRYSHLIRILTEYGTIEAMAKACSMNPAYISQMKNKTRGIGDKTARNIEAALGMREGEMDIPFAESTDSTEDEIISLFRGLSTEGKKIAIAQIAALAGLDRQG